MKKKGALYLVLTFVLALMFSLTVSAANQVTINACVIAGADVQVVTSGTAASDTGLYYLFSLEPYEGGIGARTDFCASAPAGPSVTFTVPLGLNTAQSKLFSRFVVAVQSGGSFVPVSNEMYITNPEACATVATGNGAKNKRGVIGDWRYMNDLSDLNLGYAGYILDVSKFFTQGGIDYTYNGKNYTFSAKSVQEYDIVVSGFSAQGCNVIMAVVNGFYPNAADMVPAAGRVGGMSYYSFNVQEQVPTEKLEALLNFLANRYNGANGHGTIYTWIVGNECNNNSPAHYMGPCSVEQFSADYAKQLRLFYNAIKSVNASAYVMTDIDQRWNWVDPNTPLQYAARTFLDQVASNIKATGDIDWGLTFHPHGIPMDNCKFWNLPPAYAGLKLISNNDNSKMASIQNMEVFVNHMRQASMLSPAGRVRHLMITEIGFNCAANAPYETNEQIQAAALVYAYKKAMTFPEIETFMIHKLNDDAAEAASDVSYGLRVMDYQRYAYQVYKNIDNPAFTDFALPIIGVSSWAQLGVN